MSGRQGGAILFGVGVAAEAADETCAGVGLHDIPHLRLTARHTASLCEGVVGVHLDGEVLGSIDDLEEQGEVGAETGKDLVTDEVAHVDLYGLIEGVLGQETVGDDRLAALDRGERPQLAAVGQGLIVEAVAFQLVATPDNVLVEGEELKWVE